MCEKQGAVEVDQKIKTAAGKAPLAILPWPILLRLDLEDHLIAIEGLAWAVEYGSRKYRPYNYAKAEPDLDTALLYLSANLRHRQKRRRQDYDAESGLPHIDHESACLVMLLAIFSKSPKLSRDYRDLLVLAEGVEYEPYDLLTFTGELRWDLETPQGLTEFIRALVCVTKSHFTEVERITQHLKRQRGEDVPPAST
jgi:hypothetical protein